MTTTGMSRGAGPGGPVFVWYTTGHGYGHAIRSVAVLEEILHLAPCARVFVRSAASPSLFDGLPGNHLSISPVTLDFGTIDTPDWGVDVEATKAGLEELADRREALIEAESHFVKEVRANAVVLDVPWMAAPIAWKAGVPSVAVANFTWDQIYEPILGGGETASSLLAQIRQDYGLTALALQTPLGGRNLAAFPHRRAVPLIARRARRDPGDIRRELDLGPDDVAVLCALRGNDVLPRAGGRRIAGKRLVTLSFQPAPAGSGDHLQLEPAWQTRFPDLVAASDVVLSKPGYGIAGECVANQTPLLHLPRTGFAETKPLLADLDGMGKHRPVSREALASPDFLANLLNWLEEWDSNPWLGVGCNGAAVVAELVLSISR